jgi:hypothetical protein
MDLSDFQGGGKNGYRHEFCPRAASGASSTRWAEFQPVPIFAAFIMFRIHFLLKDAPIRFKSSLPDGHFRPVDM